MSNDLRLLQEQLLQTEMPAHRAELRASATKNLPSLATYIEKSYGDAGNDAVAQQAAFQQARELTVQALASVAYQIHNVSSVLLQVLDTQEERLNQLNNAMRQPRRVSVLAMHKRRQCCVAVNVVLEATPVIRPLPASHGPAPHLCSRFIHTESLFPHPPFFTCSRSQCWRRQMAVAPSPRLRSR
jgi:hypothetical protein